MRRVIPGAQEPQCTLWCMRIPGTVERRCRFEKAFRKLAQIAIQAVASDAQPVTASAQEPQCTDVYMRIPSTAGRRQRVAQQV